MQVGDKVKNKVDVVNFLPNSTSLCTIPAGSKGTIAKTYGEAAFEVVFENFGTSEFFCFVDELVVDESI